MLRYLLAAVILFTGLDARADNRPARIVAIRWENTADPAGGFREEDRGHAGLQARAEERGV